MLAGCGDEGHLGSAENGVKVYAADALEKMLFQEPLLDPLKGGIIIFDCDDEGELSDEEGSELSGELSKENAYATDEHEKEAAGGELILALEEMLEKSEHEEFLARLRGGGMSGRGYLRTWLS